MNYITFDDIEKEINKHFPICKKPYKRKCYINILNNLKKYDYDYLTIYDNLEQIDLSF
jgi:hypothetical protein